MDTTEQNIEDVSTDNQTEQTQERVLIKAKPLPQNKFAAFFVGLYRKWLGVWYGFADGHKKAADLIYKIAFFFAFSMAVTVWQYIIMTFLPYAFASLNDGVWGWPNTPVGAAGGVPYVLFGDSQGLGYFIAFEIATFTAQCINFPLQRNITYRSHGNVYWQIMWYFIGWVLISVFTSAIWGICNCFMVYWNVPDAISGLLKTILTGGVSMVIFFFIFMIIFPDRKKEAESLEKKLAKAKAHGMDEAKLAELEAKAVAARKTADLALAEKEAAQATSVADAKAVAYEAAIAKHEKLQAKNAPAEEINSAKTFIENSYNAAVEAYAKRDEAVNAYEQLKAANA